MTSSQKLACLKCLFFAIFFAVLCGCMSNATDLKSSKFVKEFFQMTTSEQMQQFKNYSLDEQYKLFVYGNQVIHPPAFYLSQSFAEQGPSIVPFLKSKLKKAEKEMTTRDIVMVFSELSRLKLYDFSKDPELMGLMNRKANKMTGTWKKMTTKIISEIQANASLNAPKNGY